MPIEPVTHLEKTIAGTAEPVTHLEKVIEQYGGGGGGSVTVDAELSASSENPVQNKVINAALAAKGTYSKPSGGIPKTDLANAVQTSLEKADSALQSAPVSSVNGKTGAVVLDARDVGALPADTPIPAAVTEQTVSGWGFTKNTGTYTKPAAGIPKSDLSSAVQTSLGKANTALQSVPSGYATEAWVTGKGYQTAAQVQTAISGVRQLPVVSASDNGKFLRVVSGAWAAATVPSAETASF